MNENTSTEGESAFIPDEPAALAAGGDTPHGAASVEGAGDVAPTSDAGTAPVPTEASGAGDREAEAAPQAEVAAERHDVAHGAGRAAPRHGTAEASEGPRDAAPRHSAREVTASGTAVSVRSLELRTRQGRVFGPVDWDLAPRTHGIVQGVQGSGRSAFLLALAGRMRGVTGALQVGDIDGIAKPRHLRHRVAVARITDLAELEPGLTVAEVCDEHALADGIGRRRGRQAFAALQDALSHPFPAGTVVADLPAFERTLLAAVLACQRPAHHIVLDDADDGLTPAQLDDLYQAFGVLGGLGHHFIVSALEGTPVPTGMTSLVLPPPEPNDSLVLSFAHLHRRILAREA